MIQTLCKTLCHPLEQFTNKGLRSENSELKICGELGLDRCLMSAEFEIKTQSAWFSPKLAGNMCILGDWARKNPQISSQPSQYGQKGERNV